MKTLNNFFLIAGILILFSNCGTFKKTVNKNKEAETVNTEAETVTTRTITETTNTTITLPEKETDANGCIEDLINGETLTAENNGLLVEVKIDPATKKVNAKARSEAQTIPVTSEKKTIENVKENKKVEDLKESQSKQVNKKAETGCGWLWLLLLIILIILGLYLYKRFLT